MRFKILKNLCLTVLLGSPVGLLFGTAAAADSIRLHDQAGSASPNVTLVQIAELEGEYAASLGDLVVGRFAQGQTTLTIQLSTVRRTLTHAQANWSDLALRGRTACVVTRLDAAPVPDQAPDQNHAAAPNRELALNHPHADQTLSDLLIAQIAELTAAPLDELDIHFRGDAETAARLNRSTVVSRYEIEPLSGTGLGRVPLRVRRYDADGTAEQFTVTAEVTRRVTAVVALRSIRRGEVFTSRNLGLREVEITGDHGEFLADTDLLLGQTAAAALRQDATVYAAHVAPDLLVKRGELVTVECISGSLVIRSVGRASADGALGDIVAIRNPDTRETIYATVTGKRQASIHLQENQ
ncbi:MAG: flagellar basal body P-ring formation chaperone FlgA [Planctomycetota bacterium]